MMILHLNIVIAIATLFNSIFSLLFRFYWSVNLGAMVSYTVISYICQYGIPQLGGVEWGFFVGYLIPCVSMGIAIGVFVWGWPRYRKAAPEGSVVSKSIGIITHGLARYASLLWAGRRRVQTDILDEATTERGGRYLSTDVRAVKMLCRLFPFLLVMIPYWGIYNQTSTAFQNQACQMNLSLGSGVNVPASALNVFDSLIIILLVPLFDRYGYSAVERWKGTPFTKLQKLGCGFILALLSMIVAAVIEQARYENRREPGGYTDDSARSHISPCHDIDDYDPYQYQRSLAGVSRRTYFMLSFFLMSLLNFIVFMKLCQADVESPAHCSTVESCSANPVY